ANDRLPFSRWEVDRRGAERRVFEGQHIHNELARFFAVVVLRYSIPRFVVPERRPITTDAESVAVLVRDAMADVRRNWAVWGTLLGEPLSVEAVEEREQALLSFFDKLVIDEQEREHRHVTEQPLSA